MGVLKCKMCGGDILLNDGKTFGTCEYCGSTMTFPKMADEQRLAMFNRGNYFRRQGEFDKALAVYEAVIREDDTDAEAHWCCALCRFGIEYVEDPNTYEYLPTCHRASFDSFLEDVDYLAALKYSDGITRRQYQKDASKIAEVQRGILATSQNEEPFDVFICYKESDDQTKERTRDSLDAQDLYYQLTREGFRVFFSRVTLEEKAGTQYEPYIFAALNSAKVMVVLGSKPEYFSAVWVKNEWSRFLAMMRKDNSKLLLPCYKNMDPYSLPEQLSVLQSYDMTKIGFVQDLIRGIKKVLAKDEPKAAPVAAVTVQDTLTGNATALCKRGFIHLDNAEFDDARNSLNKSLDLNPENSKAYWGLLLAATKCKSNTELAERGSPIEYISEYAKAMRFANEPQKKEYGAVVARIHQIISDTTQSLIAREDEEIAALHPDERIANNRAKKRSLEQNIRAMLADLELNEKQTLQVAEACRNELKPMLEQVDSLAMQTNKKISSIRSAAEYSDKDRAVSESENQSLTATLKQLEHNMEQHARDSFSFQQLQGLQNRSVAIRKQLEDRYRQLDEITKDMKSLQENLTAIHKAYGEAYAEVKNGVYEKAGKLLKK